LHGKGVTELAIAGGADGARPTNNSTLTLFSWWASEPLDAWFSDAGWSRIPLLSGRTPRTLDTGPWSTNVPRETTVTLDAGGTVRSR